MPTNKNSHYKNKMVSQPSYHYIEYVHIGKDVFILKEALKSCLV